MARIRTIKPEFWADEKLGPLEPITRLVFLGLISHADDAGRLVDSVRQLDGLIFPHSEESSRDSLDTLARLSRLVRYTSASGQRLIQVANWGAHQKVDKPSRYVLPAPAAQDLEALTVADSSRDTRETLARHSRDTRAPTLDRGPTTTDPGPGSGPHARAHEAAEAVLADLENPLAPFEGLTTHATRAVKGLYGWGVKEGTDERVWGCTPHADRPRLLSIATARLVGEGAKYQGRLYRRILASVVEEQHQESAEAGAHWDGTE